MRPTITTVGRGKNKRVIVNDTGRSAEWWRNQPPQMPGRDLKLKRFSKGHYKSSRYPIEVQHIDKNAWHWKIGLHYSKDVYKTKHDCVIALHHEWFDVRKMEV